MDNFNRNVFISLFLIVLASLTGSIVFYWSDIYDSFLDITEQVESDDFQISSQDSFRSRVDISEGVSTYTNDYYTDLKLVFPESFKLSNETITNRNGGNLTISENNKKIEISIRNPSKQEGGRCFKQSEVEFTKLINGWTRFKIEDNKYIYSNTFSTNPEAINFYSELNPEEQDENDPFVICGASEIEAYSISTLSEFQNFTPGVPGDTKLFELKIEANIADENVELIEELDTIIIESSF